MGLEMEVFLEETDAIVVAVVLVGVVVGLEPLEPPTLITLRREELLLELVPLGADAEATEEVFASGNG